jgi:hypothetical protein
VSQLVSAVYADKKGYSAPLTQSIDQTKMYFTANDYVWLNMGTDANMHPYLGFLTLPVQVSSNCRTGPPLFYLKNTATECFVDSVDIINECNSATATSSLSLAYFYNTFMFIQVGLSLYFLAFLKIST